MKISVPKFLVSFLKKNQVNFISTIPGGGLMEILDICYDDPGMRAVLVRHEQAAAFIAHGYARATGKPSVCMATKSPGATNLVNGITAAFIESTPVIAISGDVSTDFKGRDCFEEADLVSIFRPITKWSASVPTAKRIPEYLREAFRVSLSGRPGPVHLAIPANFFKEEIDINPSELEDVQKFYCRYDIYPNPSSVKDAAEVIANAKRPMIIAGGGVLQSGASEKVVELAELFTMPMATTYRKKPIPEDHRLYVGPTGITGVKASSKAFKWADAVIAIGCRFSEFATDTYGMDFTGKELVHIDIDPRVIGKVYPVSAGIVSDAKAAVSSLLDELKTKTLNKPCNTENLEFVTALVREWHDDLYDRDFDKSPISHGRLLKELRETLERDAYVVLDSGNFASWTSWYFKTYVPGTFLFPTSGSMGFGLPGAIGVKLAHPDKQVVSISGDGGFAMTMQELETAARENIKVLSVVVNNYCLSNIKVRQKYKYNERYSGVDFVKPQDFAGVAKALGCYAETVTQPEELGPALNRCLNNLPAVLDVRVDPEDTNTSQTANSWSEQ